MKAIIKIKNVWTYDEDVNGPSIVYDYFTELCRDGGRIIGWDASIDKSKAAVFDLHDREDVNLMNTVIKAIMNDSIDISLAYELLAQESINFYALGVEVELLSEFTTLNLPEDRNEILSELNGEIL